MKNYYGEETKKALKNFPFDNHKTKEEFIRAMAQIKKAAAIANYKAGNISAEMKKAVIKICDEILKGKHDGQFPLSAFQGGAGTACHMNVNEVIANRASEILKNKIKIHPIDHVNRGQSTNDVNPSALKISVLFLLEDLNHNLFALVKSLQKKAKKFKDISKLGRTHLQDAVPTTLGAEFSACAENLKEHGPRIQIAVNLCQTLHLGGTAIGNSINADPVYIKEIYRELNKITGRKFRKASNLMAKTGGQVDFLIISQTITALCVDLSKMASDLRLMASGPRGGIGEIILPELQKGSSIMPGKVNPVMPETVNQLYYLVSGNNLAIEKAVEGAQLELGVMIPIIIDKLIESTKLAAEVIRQFDKRCVRGIKADQARCRHHLENSTAYATLFAPLLGYDTVAEIVKKSIASGRTIREIIVGEKILSESKFNKIAKID